MSVNQIVLQPASVDCSNYQEEESADLKIGSTKVIIVPIRIRLDLEEEGNYTLAFACNMQERCRHYPCIYARLKQAKKNKEYYDFGVSPL